VPLKYLDGLDSLLSIVQMPAGVPVATVSIGGARNAGLLAVRILAASDEALRAKMAAYQEGLKRLVAEKDAALQAQVDS
jgi:5-(carboxyamino)imidazole ribonucleotide mutase